MRWNLTIISSLTVLTLALCACSDDTSSSDPDGSRVESDGGDLGITFDGANLGDGVEDEPDLFIEPDELEELCQDYCDSFEECDRGDEVGGDDCLDECLADLEDDPDDLINVACGAESDCDGLDICLDEIEVSEGCEEVCENTLSCGFNAIFELPADPDTCAALCSGSLAGEDSDEEVVECFNEALEDDCDGLTARACFDDRGEIDCEDRCGRLEGCSEDDAIVVTLGGFEGCVDYCDDLNAGQRSAFDVCISTTACDTDACAELPDEPSDECYDACDVALDECSESSFDELVCPWHCLGVDVGVHPTDISAAPDCLADLDECPDDGDSDSEPAYLGALIVCSVVLSEDCATVCEPLAECDDGSVRTLSQCAGGCVEAEENEPELVGQVLDCVGAISEDSETFCDELEDCLPDEPER